MTDHETHPVGTDDLVKRLRDYEEYEQSRDGQIICVKSDITQEAAARIERLEAENRELAMQVLASDSQAQEAYEAQLKAEAATAAAYEVAADLIESHRKQALAKMPSPYLMGRNDAKWVQANSDVMKILSADIRALATPDQTAALDRLIAEAEARVLDQAALWVEEAMVIVAPESVPQRMALDSYRKQFSTLVRASLAASKKGGV